MGRTKRQAEARHETHQQRRGRGRTPLAVIAGSDNIRGHRGDDIGEGATELKSKKKEIEVQCEGVSLSVKLLISQCKYFATLNIILTNAPTLTCVRVAAEGIDPRWYEYSAAFAFSGGGQMS